MNKKRETLFIYSAIASFVLVATFAISWWFTQENSITIHKSIPGMDKLDVKKYAIPKESVRIGEFFQKYSGVVTKTSSLSWSRFRGTNFDNICTQNISLPDKWPKDGPKILWKVKLGEGHAAPAIRNGKVYLLDYDDENKDDVLRCFSIANGEELWRRWYKIKIKRNHGISRTIPAVNDDFVVTIGPKCQTMCVDSNSGDFLWGFDLAKDFGTKIPLWYTGQCPIIDKNIAIIAPAGKDILMMGVDCRSGKILWKTPNIKKMNMSHSSIMIMTIAGKRVYVYAAIGGIVAVSAEEGDLGDLLWSSEKWSHSVISPSPLYIGDDKIFLTAGYGGGSMVIKINAIKGDKGNTIDYKVEVLQEITPKEGIACEQQTPIFIDDKIYSILPKDSGLLRQQFVAVNASDITKIVNKSGKNRKFGLGPFIFIDNKFFILSDDGILSMMRTTGDGFLLLGKAKVLDGHDAWGPIAIAGSKMLLRDSKNMVCIDLETENKK